MLDNQQARIAMRTLLALLLAVTVAVAAALWLARVI